MAVQFEGGVVMGADSRTTTGAYIANRTSDKITSVHDRIYVCRSGSAADTQAIADNVRYGLDVHRFGSMMGLLLWSGLAVSHMHATCPLATLLCSVELGEPPLVLAAAKLFRRLCYQYKNQLMAGVIVAGWDDIHGGSVYTIPLGGTLVKQPFSIGGSGSTYIYGYCDANYKENMTKEEALQFVRNGMWWFGSLCQAVRYCTKTPHECWWPCKLIPTPFHYPNSSLSCHDS
jgi:20S proteasome subunit beta 1